MKRVTEEGKQVVIFRRKIFDAYKNGEVQEFVEMSRARLVPFGDYDTLEVYINANDTGTSAHFHVRRCSPDKVCRWDATIHLGVVRYCQHGGKDSKRISDKLAAILDRIFKTRVKFNGVSMRYYKLAKICWNENNPRIQFDPEHPLFGQKPNYTQLNSSRFQY